MSDKEELRFPTKPATDLDSAWTIFDPIMAVDPSSEFYVPRSDIRLQQLTHQLKRSPTKIHAFLCGHRGSGKTTELRRLSSLEEIKEKFLILFLSASDFRDEIVDLTHDALILEMGLALIETGKEHGLSRKYEKELDEWGRSIVKSFFHDQEVDAEAGTKARAWIPFFSASLKSRRQWSVEKRELLDPKIRDLVNIVNRTAVALQEKAGKQLLVILDDLEKGDSDAHHEMHERVFQENYESLVKPRFSVIYTLPIYFRALPGNRIPHDELYNFSALRIYSRDEKKEPKPGLAKDGDGYRLMRDFVERRIAEGIELFESDEDLDELIRIGGGLFRETARAIQQAAFFAQTSNAAKIGAEHTRLVFDQLKKDFQPMIRGRAVETLKAVDLTLEGWVDDVEPFLQSRAVVEYENGEIWLDLRYVLKEYVRELKS